MYLPELCLFCRFIAVTDDSTRQTVDPSSEI
jgi:hypothetical protein